MLGLQRRTLFGTREASRFSNRLEVFLDAWLHHARGFWVCINGPPNGSYPKVVELPLLFFAVAFVVHLLLIEVIRLVTVTARAKITMILKLS